MTAPGRVNINITANAAGAVQVVRSVSTALAQLTNNNRANTQAAQQFELSLGKLARQAILFRTVLAGASAFAGFVREGLKFNETIETGTLAIASLIVAEGRLESKNEGILTGSRALAAGMELATEQVNKLRIAGLRTAATTEQLIDAFQQAVGAGIAAGLSLDEVRKTTIQIVQAAGALGVPLNQLNQEVRSILDATIDRNSRVARVLGITNEQVRLQREQGTLAQFLNDKLEAFTTASIKAANTWKVIKSNMLEALQVFAGDATRPFFDGIKTAFSGVLEKVFDFDKAQIAESFAGLLTGSQDVFKRLGDLVSGAISRGVAAAQSLGEWFKENRTQVDLFLDALAGVATSIGNLVAKIVDVTAGIVKWGIESGAFVSILHTIEDLVKLLTSGMGVLIPLAIGKWLVSITGITRAYGILSTAIATAARVSATLGSGAGITAGLTSIGAATGVAPAIAVLGTLAATYTVATLAINAFNDAQEKQEALKTAVLQRIVNERTEITKATAEYAKLGRQIVENKVKAQDAADTLQSLFGILQKAPSGDSPAMDNEIERTSFVLNDNARKIREIVTQQQNLRKEEILLRQQIEKGNLSQDERAKKSARVQQIMAELNKLEGAYKGVIKDSTDEIRRSLEVQEKLANLRLAETELIRDNIGVKIKELQARLDGTLSLDGQNVPQDENLRSREVVQKLAERKQVMAQLRELTQVQNAYNLSVQGERAAVLKVRAEKNAVDDVTLTGLRTTDTDKNAKKAAAKFQNDIKQIADGQIREIKAQFERVRATIEEQRAAGEIGFKTATEAIMRAQQDAIDQEIRVRTKLASQLTDRGEKEKELSLVKALGDERVQVEQEANAKIVTFRRRLIAQTKLLEADLLEAEGKGLQAEKLRIEEEFRKVLLDLNELGDGASIDLVLRLKNAKEVKAQVEQIAKDLQKAETESDRQLKTTSTQVDTGTITPNDAKQATLKALEELRKKTAQARFDLLLLFATTGNEAAKKELEDVTTKLQDLDVQIAQAKQSMHEFRDAVGDALQSSLVDFMTADLSSLGKVEDAFRNLANSVVTSIQRMIAQIIAFNIVKSLLGIPLSAAPFGGFGSGSAAQAATQAASVAGSPFGNFFAEGGHVKGPGTSRSDSIPAWLSNGEYVIKASVVRKIGVKALDELNFGASTPVLRRRRHRFADGGLVDATHGQVANQGRGGSSEASLSATIGLEEGLVAKHLESNGAIKALLRVVSRNRTTFRLALGR